MGLDNVVDASGIYFGGWQCHVSHLHNIVFKREILSVASVDICVRF